MKNSNLILIFLITIPFCKLVSQNEKLDIRIAEKLKPSEAFNLYKEYNVAATDFNYYKKEYLKKNRNNILMSLAGGIVWGYLAYSLPVDDSNEYLYSGLGFCGGFLVGRYLLASGFRENKKKALNSYNYALSNLPYEKNVSPKYQINEIESKDNNRQVTTTNQSKIANKKNRDKKSSNKHNDIIKKSIITAKNDNQSSLGLIVGTSISSLNNFDESQGLSANLKFGLSIGAAYEKFFNSHLSIQPEIRFTQMGAKIEGYNPNSGSDETILSYQYITIPILLKYYLGSNSTRFFMQVGPRIGYGIGVAISDSNGFETSQSFDDARINKLDYGLELGAGISFEVGSGSILVDAKYYLGLQNLNTEEYEPNPRNKAIGINFGYLFFLN